VELWQLPEVVKDVRHRYSESGAKGELLTADSIALWLVSQPIKPTKAFGKEHENCNAQQS
jgi:hypothetical protein